MPEPKGFLVVPIGFRADGTLRSLELTDSDELKVYINSTVLDDILTALEKIDDLQNALDSVGTDELDVNVEVSVLPTGAATSAAQATALTELQAKLETADLEIVTSIPSTGPHGWIGGAWQRNAFPLGYSDRIAAQVTTTDTGEGVTVAESGAVPAGELWVIQSFIGWHNDAGANLFYVELWNGSTTIPVGRDPALATNVSLVGTCPLVLKEGDKLRCRGWSIDTDKNVNIAYWGYRVDIDQ